MSGALASCCQLAEYALDSDECKAVLEMDLVRSVDIDGSCCLSRERGYPGQWRVSLFRGIGHNMLRTRQQYVLDCTTAAHSDPFQGRYLFHNVLAGPLACPPPHDAR